MIEDAAKVNGADVYIACPDKSAAPWVMGFHGSGRGAFDYRDTPFYRMQRDIALRNGFSFASVSMGSDVWLRPRGTELCEALYRLMVGRGFDASCALWASSAGGSHMYSFVQRHPERVKVLLGIFPVWDIEKINLPSLRAAWDGETDIGASLRRLNPARKSLPDVPIVIAHGIHDKAVPLSEHTLALAAKYPAELHLCPCGHSADAFMLYDTPLFDHALKRASP